MRHTPLAFVEAKSLVFVVLVWLDSDKGFSYPSAERYSRIRLYETDETHLLYFS